MTTNLMSLRANLENLCIGNSSQIRRGPSYVSNCSVNSSSLFDERKLSLPQFVHWIIGGIMIGIFIIGLCENITVLFVYMRNPKLRTVNSAFVIGLSLSDLGQTLFNIPFVIIASFSRRWVFGHVGCMYIGCITTWFGITQISLLCIIAIERYFIIVHKRRKYSDTITRAHCVIVGCFIYGLCFAIAPVIGWSEYKLVPGEISCSINWSDSGRYNMSYTLTLFVLVWFVPLSCIIFGYVRITMVVCADRDRRRKIKLSRNSRKTSRERKVAITVLLMVGAFVMSWTPYSIVALMSAFSDMTDAPASVYLVPAAFAKASIIWNPIIYISRHRKFKQACGAAFECGNNNESKNESENKVSVTCRNRRCCSTRDQNIDNIIGFNRDRPLLRQQSSLWSSEFGSCFKESIKDTMYRCETLETNTAATADKNDFYYMTTYNTQTDIYDNDLYKDTVSAFKTSPLQMNSTSSECLKYLDEDANIYNAQKLTLLKHQTSSKPQIDYNEIGNTIISSKCIGQSDETCCVKQSCVTYENKETIGHNISENTDSAAGNGSLMTQKRVIAHSTKDLECDVIITGVHG